LSFGLLDFLHGSVKELTRTESIALLLATPRLRKQSEHIWQRTFIFRDQFATLYQALLEG
jgi:hypothetical protein